MQLSMILEPSNTKTVKLADGTCLLYCVESNAFVVTSPSLLQAVKDDSLPDGALDELECLQRHGVFDSMRNHNIVEQSHPQDGADFALNVNLTNRCNLKCIYCFAQGGAYGSEELAGMTDRALSRIRPLVLANRPQAGNARIEYFGGEPLLNFSGLKRVFLECQSLEAEHGIRFTHRISTNLTFLGNEMLDVLAQGRFVISVSIDGNREVHDTSRPDINGKGSFDTIIANCNAIRESSEDVTLVARITYYDGAVDLLDNVRQLVDLNVFDYVQILPALSCSQNKAHENAHSVGPQPYSAEIARFIAGYHTLLSSGNRFKGEILLERIADMVINDKIALSYCSAGKNYFTLSTGGDLYLCHRLAEQPDFLVPATDTEQVLPTRQWRNNVLSSAQCSKCWARYLCGGGCKQENFNSTGDVAAPSSAYCLIQKTIIKNMLAFLLSAAPEYVRMERGHLDRLFVSCGKPMIKRNENVASQYTDSVFHHFQVHNFL